jgi:two-component system, LytTR family, response regulator
MTLAHSIPTLQALIVDDEAPARSALRKLLATYSPHVNILGEAANVPEAMDKLAELNPNLLFLDITMPMYSGFELVERLDNDKLAVIYVTAHSEYALRAFRCQATDYLLKPISVQELEQAVARAQVWLSGQWLSLGGGMQAPQTDNGVGKRLSIPTLHGHRLVKYEEIEAIIAGGAYATLVLQTGEEILVSQSLAEISRQLPQPLFYQIHRSCVLHVGSIREILRSEGGQIVANSLRSYPLAKSRREGLETMLFK